MTGFFIGLVCGAGELFLLSRLTGSIQAGISTKTVLIVVAKVLLYAAALVPVALFYPHELIWCGVGISSVLVIGAFVINMIQRKKGKGDR